MRLLPVLVLAACAKAAPPPPAASHAPHADHDGHAGDAHGEGDRATMTHRFDDAERWSAVFDDPGRDAWQKPDALVAALGIVPGSTVADIGAGTGYLNRYLADAVGPEGRVVAIDVEASLVDHMVERVAAEGTAQVEVRLGAYDDPGLRPGEADLVLLVDTYHHIDRRIAYFGRLRDAVAEGGRLVVVDFHDGELPVGPPPGHKLAPHVVKFELQQAGWTHAASLPDVLPYQYVEVFTR